MSSLFQKAHARSGFGKHVLDAYPAALEFIEAGGTRSEWLWLYAQTRATMKTEEPGEAKPKTPKQKPKRASGKATAAARDHVAESIYFTRIAGRYIGTVRIRELSTLADRSQFDMRVCAHLAKECKSANPLATVRESISPHALAAILKESE